MKSWMAGTSPAMTVAISGEPLVRLRQCQRSLSLSCLWRLVAGSSSLGPLPLREARQVSQTVVDRNGKLLRAYAMADGRWRLPVDAKANVDPTYLKLLFAYEDKRFYSHDGVDPLAMTRAAIQLFTRGHIVSGGSTITMQLARLMEPRHERSVYAKLHQMVRAVEIEQNSARTRSSISISRWRPMAAISRAFVRPRSPISARSRSG